MTECLRSVVLAVCILLLSTTTMAKEGTMYVKTHVLNVRKGPGTEFEAVSQLHWGDRVVIIETTKAYVPQKYLLWAKIASSHWVALDLLSETPPGPEPNNVGYYLPEGCEFNVPLLLGKSYRKLKQILGKPDYHFVANDLQRAWGCPNSADWYGKAFDLSIDYDAYTGRVIRMFLVPRSADCKRATEFREAGNLYDIGYYGYRVKKISSPSCRGNKYVSVQICKPHDCE